MTTQQITVVGSFGDRQRTLACLYRLQRQGSTLEAFLVREPGNVHDPNAIVVLMGPAGVKYGPVGYIPRQFAAELAPQIDAGAPVEITRVRINRDWSKGYPVHEVKLTIAVVEPKQRPFYVEGEEVLF